MSATRRFYVEGMDCASCARTVEKAVAGLPGVQDAHVSFGNASLVVDGAVEPADVEAAVGRAGYRARSAERRRADPGRPFWRRDARTVSTTASVLLLLVAVAVSLAAGAAGLAAGLYLASMAVGGWPIARSAATALRRRRLDMNVLMTLAAVGAVGIGEYAEGAWVLVLFAVGTTLEAMALDRSRRSVESLMELAPDEARVLIDGQERTVPVDEVTVGSLVVVRPGERLPLDGVVNSGASAVDQAPITGESVPVDRQAGDEVFAGTLNGHGALVVRCTRPAGASTLARIAELVEQAQGTRAPAERFIDRFAAVYTPAVFVAALALAVLPPVAFGGDWDTWTYRALALLIVACPCSLVISVPVAVVSAVGGAARRGVLIKGGQALEDLGRIEAVAFDKTGTLTLGLPRLVSAGGDPEALRLLAGLEQRSEHPLAGAVVRAARDRDLTLDEPSGVTALPGRGLEGRIGARTLWAGSPRLATERAGRLPDEVHALEAAGQTAIVLGEGDRVLAVFGVADQPRPESPAAMRRLRSLGLEEIVMLTGDREPVAGAVAARLDVPSWRAELLPEDKLRAVEELAQRHRAVAMVGDGINDAPALARATVGVAMGAAGSDVALRTADVALMSDRLDRLADALQLARRTLGIMRFNVAASLVVKGVLVVLAPFGFVTLVMAVAADMGMSLLVTLNALRLLRGERSDGGPAAPEAARSQEGACADACCAAVETRPAGAQEAPAFSLPMAATEADRVPVDGAGH